MLVSVHRLAMPNPDEIDLRLSEITEESEDYEYYQQFKKAQKAKHNLHDNTQTSKRIADLAVVRHLELATIMALTVGSRFEQCIQDFTLSHAIETFSDALSIHYAIDVKPSEAFVMHIKSMPKNDEIKELVDMLMESCGIGEEDEPLSSEIDITSTAQPVEETVIPGTQTWQSQVFSQASQRLSQPVITRPSQDFGKTVAMSPITLNSHWTRLKSKTLRRRSTDTDLSRLVDLPPVPPRLSQVESQTPKRKGVLVHVADLSPSKLSTSNGVEDVMAWETPVKMRRGASQTSQSLATQSTDFGTQTTVASLVILETPPRASIGALESRREPVGRVASFQI